MATTKPSGTDDDQLWRDYLETGIKALNGGNLHLAEVALLDSLKHTGSNGGSTYHVEQSLELLGELAARIYFENEEERAVQLCEQILQIGYPILGGQNSAVYTAACLLADRYFDLEQEQSTTPKQAVLEELAQILSQAGQVVMYEDAEMVGNGLYMLASLYYSSEQYATAERLVRQTLALRQIAPPQLQAALIQDYELFVNTLCWQSKFEEAERAAGEWMALARDVPQSGEGEETPVRDGRELYLAQIYLTQGEIYRMMERPEEAEPAYQHAIKLHEAERCDDCSEMAAILRAYARFLQANSRADEAHRMLRRAGRINDDSEDVLS
jgi:tetratricopeptide (TPR) repeat protein